MLISEPQLTLLSLMSCSISFRSSMSIIRRRELGISMADYQAYVSRLVHEQMCEQGLSYCGP